MMVAMDDETAPMEIPESDPRAVELVRAVQAVI
jgi:hypothetical protein